MWRGALDPEKADDSGGFASEKRLQNDCGEWHKRREGRERSLGLFFFFFFSFFENIFGPLANLQSFLLRDYDDIPSGWPPKIRGIWGGLGPDREFLPLPPAPEGRVVYRSAKDNDVDIFDSLPSEPSAPRAEASDDRPAWRIEGDPLFASSDSTLAGLGDSALFEDAAWRLAAESGCEAMQCYRALEAAGGDEDLARSFLGSGKSPVARGRWFC